MSQNTFGQPNPFGTPSPEGPASPPPDPEPDDVTGGRTKLLLIGGAGLAAIVLAAGAALALTGGDDEQVAVATPRPATPAPSATTTTSAPLPTSVEFAGRNPFYAAIHEHNHGGGAAAAAPAPQPTGAPSVGGAGTSGLGSAGARTVLVPGPTVTRTVEVPGLTRTVETPGPTETVTVPGPTKTVYVRPGDIAVTYLGTDIPEPEDAAPPEGWEAGDPLPWEDDVALADVEVNGVTVADLAVGEEFAFYFQLLEVDDTPDAERVRVRFGDQMAWLPIGEVQHF